jgi:hypothetical protein
MSIDADEIEGYLENKKPKSVTLSDNVNDYDQGGAAKEEKIGQKANPDLEKRLARNQYIQKRDTKMKFGDKQAISEYMAEAAEIRQRLQEQKERQLLEYDLLQEEKKLKAKLSKITDEDRQNEKEDIERLEKRKQKEIDNVYDYFNCTEEFWNKWQTDGHKPEESPANVLIQTGTVGFVCDIHRYKACIPFPDGRLATNAFTIAPIEDHIRRHDPEMHKAAIINSINEKYNKLIQERKDKTLEDKDVKFNKEIRQIESIKTRVDGDWPSAGTKITKGQKAAIRRQEEKQQEENRRVYGGLY